MDIKPVIIKILDEIKELRLKLHDNPELAFNEYKTQSIIMDYLEKIQIKNSKFINTGVVGLLNEADECVGVRADMDALPINGVFHGCGHDYHMAVTLGVARVLKELNYDKCVKFIFQPAEEGTGGALPMINEGILENPKVKNIISFHVWPGVKAGTIEAAPNASMASVDDIKIKFKGKGGHAAMPHLCVNPLLPAIQFSNDINLKSKINYDAQQPHVLTITTINCGSAPNVIADEALVMGTVRTFDESRRQQLKVDIVKTVECCAENYNCSVDVEYEEQYPPLVNDKQFTNLFIKETSKLIGEDNVLPLQPTFAAEDFAFFARSVPSVHFRLGITKDDYGTYPLHSPNFNADDDCIFYGIYIITNFILSLK